MAALAEGPAATRAFIARCRSVHQLERVEEALLTGTHPDDAEPPPAPPTRSEVASLPSGELQRRFSHAISKRAERICKCHAEVTLRILQLDPPFILMLLLDDVAFRSHVQYEIRKMCFSPTAEIPAMGSQAPRLRGVTRVRSPRRGKLASRPVVVPYERRALFGS